MQCSYDSHLKSRASLDGRKTIMRMFQAFLAIPTAVASVQANLEVLNIFRPDTARRVGLPYYHPTAVLYYSIFFDVCNFVINLAATDRRTRKNSRTSDVTESVS